MSVNVLPRQLGYMLIQDGAIAKSEGDLVNAERLATVVLRMVAVGPFFVSSTAKASIPSVNANGDLQSNEFDRLTVLFSDHQYDIVVGSGAGGISVGGGRQLQPQKQIIHVVKRALLLNKYRFGIYATMYLKYYLDEQGNRVYTLKKQDLTGRNTFSAHPARFSPEDKYSKYRLIVKKRFNLLPTQQPAQKY